MSKLLKNSFVYTILKILEKGILFFMLPIYTTYLSPSDFGSYSLVLAINAFLVLLYSISLEHGLAKFYYDIKDDSQKVKVLMGTVFTTVIVMSCLCSLFFYFFYDLLFYSFSSNNDLHSNLRIGLACIAFFPAFSIFRQMYQVKQESKRYSLLSLCYTSLLIMINLVFIMLLNMKSTGLLLGLLFANFIFFSYSVFCFYRKNGFHYDFTLLKKILRYSLPLLPHSVSNLIATLIDRIFIGYFLSLTAVGLYAVAGQIALIISVLLGAFSMAYSPIFFEKMKGSASDKNELIKISNIVIPAFCILGFALSLFAKEIVMVMAAEEYIEAYNYAMILIFVFVFQSIYIFTAGPLLINSTKRYAVVSIMSAILNGILNFIFIPVYGLYGAAVATLISKLIAVILFSYVGYQSEDKLKFNFNYLMLLPIVSLMCVWVLAPVLNNQELYLGIFIKLTITMLALSLLVLSNKDISIELKHQLRKKGLLNK